MLLLADGNYSNPSTVRYSWRAWTQTQTLFHVKLSRLAFDDHLLFTRSPTVYKCKLSWAVFDRLIVPLIHARYLVVFSDLLCGVRVVLHFSQLAVFPVDVVTYRGE